MALFNRLLVLSAACVALAVPATAGQALSALGQGSGTADSPPARVLSAAEQRLLQAAMTGNLAEIAGALADKAPVDVQGDSKMTPLGIAALYGHVTAVKALLAAGAS